MAQQCSNLNYSHLVNLNYTKYSQISLYCAFTLLAI